MNNLIYNEAKMSNEYLFDTDDNGSTVKLTQKNVALAEAIFKNDSAYFKAFDQNNTESSAYCFSKFKKHINDDNYTSYEIILEIVTALDRENSTHLNTEKII